jgi:CheY-like chemotaxis protein
MPDGGVFTIETKNISLDENLCSTITDCVPGDYVQITFSDNGTGIDHEIQNHIFEPYFTTKEIGRGTGLGLSTIYGIVSQNKGFIELISALGEGTVFKVYLPRNAAPPKVNENLTDNLPTGNGSIIVVEDCESVRKITSLFLKTLGYTVYEVESPDEVLEIVADRSRKLDLVLTDVIMPVMNGKVLVEKIRIYRPDIKVIFVSGYSIHHISLNEDNDSDFVRFIKKPYDLKILGEHLKQMINGGKEF